jgi:hypothetical protein
MHSRPDDERHFSGGTNISSCSLLLLARMSSVSIKEVKRVSAPKNIAYKMEREKFCKSGRGAPFIIMRNSQQDFKLLSSTGRRARLQIPAGMLHHTIGEDNVLLLAPDALYICASDRFADQ